MWNHSISIPGGITITYDDDGFPTETQTFITGIPANFKSTTRSDETLANQMSYTADIVIEIMECNYNGQSMVTDEKDGKEYEVKRSHVVEKKETIELTCQRR
jgi:hypothetical protein